MSINLEECSGCGLSGWGWRDARGGTKGAISSTTIRFAPTAPLWHHLRIQTRVDGVMIDQVVLSSVKHKATRPGAVKNAATSLPMTVPGQ